MAATVATPTEIAFLAAWHARQLPPATATELLPLTAAARLNLRGASRHAQLSRLGLWLSKRRNTPLRTPAGDFRIVSAGIHDGRQRWRVEAVVPITTTRSKETNE